MRPTTTLHIPQPCQESWAAMLPAGTGRHCAACQKNVVDFTLATDAEILAYLARAGSSRLCGRFTAGQLARPLQRAALAAPTARWQAWLAAALAVWGLREGLTADAKAQAATEWRGRYWGGPVPTAPAAPNSVQQPGGTEVSWDASAADESKGWGRLPRIQDFPDHPNSLIMMPSVLRGKVSDFTNQEPLPGVTVLLKGTTIGTSTNVDGIFELPIPADAARAADWIVGVSSIGYVAQEYRLRPQAAREAHDFQLYADNTLLGELIIIPYMNKLPPAPWHPRAFYRWGKFWLTRPFGRY